MLEQREDREEIQREDRGKMLELREDKEGMYRDNVKMKML